MIVFIWFQNTRTAKISAMIFGTFMLIALIIGGIFWLRDFQVQQNYQQVTAVVTDNFISQDRRTSWSDTQFQLGGQTYTVRHDFFWRMGREVELFVNADNPQQTMPATAIGASVLPAMILAGVFGLAFLFCGVNFLFNRRRDKVMHTAFTK